ncbi:Asp-tRNA(Asn)/Glu-tRNA(Gln) amidotransferase subunit GatA [Haloplanus salinus]|jgi:amidase/aspartyl-tRNA(Asn)/glutamyl-tRNA(Gln) amidotransferase subunit A|uniref:Asp-tRNA(Asn)/Glu-tRNA(Gln) amidotransferase subunit GatA n=1 Tax=Haloplanus salinus TaxID=1126245 RepID=A0A368N7S0_9EURY|nr:amidase family protein [Haloplanus salinus]RCU46628.1 Asp-tRNA(Asn)/Glu-tRNA(Gln) amidotransferase subunit GatA [Haloplanus salinus]
MRHLTADELVTLGERFDVDVDADRAADLTGTVNAMLDDLDALDDLAPVADAPSPTGADPGARTWSDPVDDPHGAVAADCSVPPSAAGHLDGVAVGIKDVVAVAGVPMRCGSATMRGFVPATDATVVDRLRAAGAAITAKTACDEFAGSARGTTGHGAPITNPHDDERTAGGSSGGSAAAVASGRVDAALGTDTGGSVRIPASFCGVVGYKPTYGLVPLTGVVENTYTQDHVGTFTEGLDDAAALVAAMAGADESDPASLAAAGRSGYRVGGYRDAVADPPAPADLRIGVLAEGTGEGVADRVEERTDTAVDALADAGADVHTVSVPSFHDGRPIKNALSFVELATHWRDGAAPYRRGGVDETLQTGFARARAAASGELSDFYTSKLLAGAQVVDAHDGRPYVRAQAARERLRGAFEDALDGVDALLLPTMPDVAPRIDSVGDWSYDYARNTRAANVTRLPAVTVPNGRVAGLPVGLQLMGPAFDDARLLSVAAAVESTIRDGPS